MRRRVVSILPTATNRILAVTALTAFQVVAVLASDDCVTKPNVRATQGGHWYYHFDRVKNHKCWFLRQDRTENASASPQPQFSDRMTASKPSSWLSSLVSAFAPASDSAERPVPLGENSTVFDSSNSFMGDELSRNEQRQIAYNSRKRRLSKPREQSGVQSAKKETADQPNAVSDRASKDALFREFILWNERQSAVVLEDASRDALFQEFLLWRQRQQTAEP